MPTTKRERAAPWSATVTSSNWIDAASVPSGNWADATHWSVGSVPGAATEAIIGPSVSATAPWTLTVTGSQAVAGMTLEIGNTQGTLSIAGALNVAGVATMGYGTLGGGTVIVAPGGSLNVGGNSVAVGSTFEVNGGTITTAGFSDLDNAVASISGGGVWNANTLWLGQFFTTGATVQGSGSAIHASTVINIGGDGGTASMLAIGTGTLRAVGGAVVVAPAMNIVDRSVLTVDTASAVEIGAAAAVGGAVAIGGNGVLSLETASVSGNVVDNGLLKAMVHLGASSLAVGTGPVITGALTGNGAVQIGGGYTMEVGSASGFAGTVNINPNGSLLIDAGAAPTGSISMAGGTLDLRGLTFGAGPALSYNGNTLTVGADNINVGTGLSAANFAVAADAKGGTLLTESAAPCYVAGTRIAAEFGEIAVEMLRPGDRVRTVAGRLAPVGWVGQTAIDLARHPQPRHAAPVRIAAGAFAPGLPRRDLLVSPDHAMMVDGVLIPAHRLVNGASIRQDLSLQAVRYVHVELDRHDLMLAEGLASESYLDTGNRGQFDGAAGPRALHPRLDADPTAHALRVFAEHGCARLVLDGPEAHAAHARLAARAGELGWARSADPALTIAADRVGAQLVVDGPDSLRVLLPPGTRQVRLGSRRFVPEAVTPGCGDSRLLGAALTLHLDDGWLDGAELGAGWYPPEDGATWRWTDGDAVLTLPAQTRSVVLSVHVAGMGAKYWAEPQATAVVKAA